MVATHPNPPLRRLLLQSPLAVSCSHLPSMSPAPISPRRLLLPSPLAVSCSHLPSPSPAPISPRRLLLPSPLDVSCSHLPSPSPAPISPRRLLLPSPLAVSCSPLPSIQDITTAAMEILDSLIFYCSTKIGLALVQAETEDNHVPFLNILRNSLRLATSNGPNQLALQDRDGQQFVHETRDYNQKWGEARQLCNAVDQMLRMEGIEDVIDETLRTDRNTFEGISIGVLSIYLNNQQEVSKQQFCIGWVTMTLDQSLNRLILNWVNEHQDGQSIGDVILAVDCWEHAYIKDYKSTARGDYLQNLVKIIDWVVVERRLKAAM
ncbi:putative superoxide dismutase, Fe-Mn family [Blattamonas nauphoetae]|uniref:superoxide dismutase n=1 Tax=Blattamonas nauphoetae TaxID=2049346 RepID=A0ABQ9YIF6_9EUKA|nr:putative superoxide dismutase, Fe-Mn family [Blattamonas nauphoetae]